MGIIADAAAFAGEVEQGKIQRREAETQALAEEAAGVSREADRKALLAQALASQNASAGAGGVAAFEGSPLTIMKADVARAGEATERDVFQTRLTARTLRARGKIAQKQAFTGGLLSFSAKMEERLTKAAKAAAGGMGGA